MPHRRSVTTFAASAVLVLAVASPASADTNEINADHLNTTAEDFDSADQCDEEFEKLNVDNTKDGWHFVVPGPSGFLELSLTFTDLDDNDVTVVIDTEPGEISSGSGWSGYFTTVGQGMVQHAWVATEAGWTLTDGSALVDDKGKPDFFNLSHTCPGMPGENDGGGEHEKGKTDDDDNGKEDADDVEVPTEVPAGHDGSSGGISAGTIGLIAAGTALLAGTAALVRRRFANGS